MKEKVIIRADASVAIGTGHVMRCLAFAQAWQRSGGGAFVFQSETTPAIVNRLQVSEVEQGAIHASAGSLEDAFQTIGAARRCAARWIVADGYRFGAEWQQTVQASGIGLLVLDDYGHAERYHADFVLNQNLSARAELYARRESTTRLLLGSRFALLRQEFLESRARVGQRSPRGRRILVTLGGSDPQDVTSEVLMALAAIPDVNVVAVVGGSNPNLPRIAELTKGNPKFRLVVDTRNMPELMAWADLAVAAAGSTWWEFALMGLPGVAIVTAANQAEVAVALERDGLGVNLGDYRTASLARITATVVDLLDDYPRREKMSRRGRELVDGGGAARVVTRLRSRCLQVRPVRKEDCRQLWEWANDPGVRASAFQQESITWEAHERWFAKKMNASNTIIYIGSDAEGRLLGQVRFDWTPEGVAVIDVSIAPASRNAGWGSALIRRAADIFFSSTVVRKVEAFVKPENAPSCRAFERAGFANLGATVQDGHAAVKLALLPTDE